MAVVAIGLIWLIVRLVRRRPNAWLWRRNIATAVVVCYVACFVDFDRMIAEFNVSHSRGMNPDNTQAQPLDVGYLKRLGCESLPALQRYARTATDDHRINRAQDAVDALSTELDRSMRDWRGWTLRRHRVQRALEHMKDNRP